MMKFKIVLLLLLSGCTLIEYHPYDANTEYSDINNTNIAKIEALTSNKESFQFIWTGDTQRFYDETEDFVEYVNENVDVDFVMHGGDISDFGMTSEFEWIHGIMSNLTVPYIALIGNHDVLATGKYLFQEMYGDDNFSFNVADIKFVCLNTNALEYDYDSVPNFDYIAEEIASSNLSQRTIVAMHAAPCGDQLDEEVGTAMHKQIKQLPNLELCLNAHGHNTNVREIFYDGITYYECASVKNRSFLLFSVTPDSINYEEIFF